MTDVQQRAAALFALAPGEEPTQWMVDHVRQMTSDAEDVIKAAHREFLDMTVKPR